jgi:hypothetical protein
MSETAAPPLSAPACLKAMASQHDRLTHAVAGVVYHWAMSRFSRHVPANGANRFGSAAMALSVNLTAYVLRVELELSPGDVASLTHRSHRRVREMVSKIEELREADQAIDHWLDEVRTAALGICADE